MDKDFYKALQAICQDDESAALVTIVQVKGSTPRKPGAKMLVLPDGRLFGTIGGGCGEAEVRRKALDALSTGEPCLYSLNMTNDAAEDEGMVCGGIMTVLIDVISSDPPQQKELLLSYIKEIANPQKPTLITTLPAFGSNLKYLVVTGDGQSIGDLGQEEINSYARTKARETAVAKKPVLLESSDQGLGTQLFFEPTASQPELIILGGGHIACPLAAMAKMLGYGVTVVDDRMGFANTARFPSADRVICQSFRRAIRELNIDSNTFVVIVTRGHRYDHECLQEVAMLPAGYVGMIGSRRRVKALLAQLIEEGIPDKALQNVHTPIGLDIGAETPEEIAVSILAELIKVQRGGSAQSLKIN